VNGPIAFVTGAGGFVGSHVVKALAEKGFAIRAGVRSSVPSACSDDRTEIEKVEVDILDRNSLIKAMKGADAVYHFAALVDARKTKEQLAQVNVEGTRNVWECAVECGVKRGLYCSSTAVYGLLARSDRAITESVRPKAVEPYGCTKLLGERVALEIATRSDFHTTIIRPVAIFGPGEHTPFGKKLRDAAVSKLLIAGGFHGRRFNYVHVEDVAVAAVHLMQKEIPSGEIFNITVNDPILFQDAFQAYIRVLERAGSSFARIRFLASVSALLHKQPSTLRWISNVLGERFVFRIWHPGFDHNYSSSKLLETSFQFHWTDFEEVFYSCLESNS
jgi:dihydroflavonol-4-reductase